MNTQEVADAILLDALLGTNKVLELHQRLQKEHEEYIRVIHLSQAIKRRDEAQQEIDSLSR